MRHTCAKASVAVPAFGPTTAFMPALQFFTNLIAVNLVIRPLKYIQIRKHVILASHITTIIV